MKLREVAQTEAKILKTITDGPKRLARYVLQSLTPEDFISETAQEVYRRLRTLYTHGRPIPRSSTLAADPALSEEARLVLQRPVSAIRRLSDLEVLLESYLQASRSEQALDLAAELAEALKDRDLERAQDVLHQIQATLQDTRGDSLLISNEPESVEDVLRSLDDVLKGKAIQLVKTGLEEFDRRSGGLPRGAITLIGANTGGGKSTLALNMAVNQAKMGYKVLYISLEMGKEELLARIASRLSRVPFTRLYQGLDFKPEARKHVLQTMGKFLRHVGAKGGSLEIYVPRHENFSMEDVCAYARGREIDVLYVDYIGLLRDLSRAKAKWENLGDAVRNAALFASAHYHQDKKPAVVILVQYDKKKDQVRYSRAMEEHASLVWAWVYDDTARSTHRIKIRQMKTRNQPQYDFWLVENFQFCEIRSAEVHDDLQPSQPIDQEDEEEPELITWIDSVEVESRPSPEG